MAPNCFVAQNVRRTTSNNINNLTFAVTHSDADRPMTPNSESLQGFYIGWCVTCVTCVTYAEVEGHPG
jgi:hypothetical protein